MLLDALVQHANLPPLASESGSQLSSDSALRRQFCVSTVKSVQGLSKVSVEMVFQKMELRERP